MIPKKAAWFVCAVMATSFIANPTRAQNFSAAPEAQTLGLVTGFAPQTVETVSGADPGEATFNAPCGGVVSEAADVHVLYTGGAHSLAISAQSNSAITLLINAPNGTWRCEGSEAGASVTLQYDGPLSGRYAIWVGAVDGSSAATISVAEIPVAEPAPP